MLSSLDEVGIVAIVLESVCFEFLEEPLNLVGVSLDVFISGSGDFDRVSLTF